MAAVILSGVIMGLLYAVAGLGLVVVYRASKVLNFAMGGVGAISAYAASDLLRLGLPYPVTIILALVVGGLVGALLDVAIAGPMRARPHLTVALATLGALLIFEGLLGLRYGYAPRSLPPSVTGGQITLGSVTVSGYQALVVVLAVVATAALFWFIMKTRIGIMMRAVSSGPMTAELLGANTTMVRRQAWVLGGVYGALAALLVTPLTYLSPHSFTVFLLTAFAAVVLGGFTSIVGVVVGALAFGVATNLLLSYFDSGLISTYTFLGIALVLVLRPHGLFGRRERDVPEPRIARSRKGASASKTLLSRAPRLRRPRINVPVPPRNVRLASGGLFAMVLVILPFLVTERRLFLMATTLAAFVGVVGLNVLVGYTGQVSLGHSAFLAIGAYTAAIAASHGISPLVGLLLAVLTGGVVGVLLGLPATRLSGVYLTLLTLIFAFAMPELILYLKQWTGGANGLPLSPPEVLYEARNMYWFMLAIAAVCGLVVYALNKNRVGRSWRAVRDSEAASISLGLNPARVKLGAFALGSALAALSGALTGLLIGYVGQESYGVFVSIYALLAVVLGGSGSVVGSLLGALFITAVPDLAGGSGIPQDLLFGLALLLVLFVAPRGLVGLFGGLLPSRAPHVDADDPDVEGLVAGAARSEVAAVRHAGAVHADLPAVPRPILELKGVTAGYGAGPAIRDIDLTVGEGEVVALLGANGAGKSTLLRAVSGLLPLEAGEMRWQGDSVNHERHTPAVAARAGIAHVPEGRGIFPDLTVQENLTTGTFAGRQSRPDREILDEVFQLFPILRDRIDQSAGTLSGGEQQMLAIGRALVARPRLLMLDEPSLGLSPLFSQKVFEVLGEVAKKGVSILLVEQNARASLRLAQRAYVLARGQVVLAGDADSVAENKSLSSSYLAASDD